MGAVNNRPDYDYAEGLELRLYQLKDGAEAACKVPCTDGTIVNTITAVRCGNEITLKIANAAGEMKLAVYNGTEVKETVVPAGVCEFKVEL